MLFSHESEHTWEGLNKQRGDQILRAAVISLCALLCRFHPPDSFAKPPPGFSLCYSSHAVRSGPFALECSLCWPYSIVIHHCCSIQDANLYNPVYCIFDVI